VVDPDGSSQTTLVTTYGCITSTLAWAPDRSRVYIGCGYAPGRSIVAYDGPPDPAGPTSVKKLPVVLPNAEAIAVSPDSRRIAFTWNHRIYLANSDGSHQHLLSAAFGKTPDIPLSLGWSPDGSQILIGACVYSPRYTCVKGLLMTMPATGGRPRLILSLLEKGTPAAITPRWSAKAKKILFTVCVRTGDCKLALVNPDGTGYHTITRYQDGLSAAARWSPDGSRIAFVGRRKRDGFKRYVYLITPSGKLLGKLPTKYALLIDW
jgi:dipeptidyl aminopeptidase/acylaminoacyl peptidase